ncbi:MAG: phosphoribosylformylglycinamidine synthase I [Endomicrobiia bacterium]
MKPKAIVLRVAGTNCDKETVNALRLVGFETDLVHINEVIRKDVDILDFELLVIPGGFSFGDYISAGKVFAIEIYYKLKDSFEEFINKDKFIVGICNGFQVLVKLGLLPYPNFKQQATLTDNISSRFECRWVYLKTNKNNPSPLSSLPDIIELPVAHAEGNFFTEENTLKHIIENNLYIFQYCDSEGKTNVGYPLNPNGSLYNIAGITDSSGRIIGLMPHPERFVVSFQHPLYNQINNKLSPSGRLFFELLYKAIKSNS